MHLSNLTTNGLSQPRPRLTCWLRPLMRPTVEKQLKNLDFEGILWGGDYALSRRQIEDQKSQSAKFLKTQTSCPLPILDAKQNCSSIHPGVDDIKRRKLRGYFY